MPEHVEFDTTEGRKIGEVVKENKHTVLVKVWRPYGYRTVVPKATWATLANPLSFRTVETGGYDQVIKRHKQKHNVKEV